jgi:hypothetical protein
VLGKLLMDDLNLSRDSAYRRVRGETSLSPDEIKILCTKYDISFDKIMGIEGQTVTFQYNPINKRDYTIGGYMAGVNFGFTRLSSQRTATLYLSNLDITVFQLLNFPDLIRLKLLYFAKIYIKAPKYQDVKFSIGWKGDLSDELILDSLQKYTKIQSVEVIGIDAGKGLIREIVTFYEAGHIESKEDCIALLDQVGKCFDHVEDQMKISKKYIYGYPIPASENKYEINLTNTYLQDNTFLADTNAYRMLYITHNMINYLYTHDTDYVNHSFRVFQNLIQNCSALHGEHAKKRKLYFEGLHAVLDKAKTRIEGVDLF